MFSRTLGASIPIALCAVAYAGVSALGPPREDVVRWLAVVFGTLPLLLVSIWWCRPGRMRRRAFRSWAFGSAVLLRLAVLPAPVSLSDDVHRYAWDGDLVRLGVDPYAHRPRALRTRSGFGEERLASLNSPDYYTVYPPLAQVAFATGVTLARSVGAPPVSGVRFVLLSAELLGLWVLLSLGDRYGYGRRWLLLYAFHPLVVWEMAAGVHTEALLIAPLLLSLHAAVQSRPRSAGAWLALAAMAKLTALVFGPAVFVFLWRRGGAKRALLFALASLFSVVVISLPLASPLLLPHVGESLWLFNHEFSFNAPLFYAARHHLGYFEGWTASVDHRITPFFRVATALWIALAALWPAGDRASLARSLTATYLGCLLLSRVIHPWYVVVPLLLGSLGRRASIAFLAALIPLSYLRYQPLGREEPLVLWAQFSPFIIVAGVEMIVVASRKLYQRGLGARAQRARE